MAKRDNASTRQALEGKLARAEQSDLPPVKKCAVVAECHWALATARLEAPPNEQGAQATLRLAAALQHARQAELLGGHRFDYPFLVAQLAHSVGQPEEAGRSIRRCANPNADDEFLAAVAEFLAIGVLDCADPSPHYLEALAKLLVDCPECIPPRLHPKLAALVSTSWSKFDVALGLSRRANQIDPSLAFYLRVLSAQASSQGNEAEAARYLEEYFARIPDPFLQAEALAKRMALDPSGGPVSEIPISEKWPSARACYNAGTTLQQLIKGASEKSRLWIQKAAQSYYDIALRRFESHFATRSGTPEDGDAHIYSMCCRNRAMLHLARREFPEALELHDRGIVASPFYEHYDDRSTVHWHLNDPVSASKDSILLLTEYKEDLTIGKVVVHLFRALSGLTQSDQTDDAVTWAARAIETVQSLDAEDRASASEWIPGIYEVAARAYRMAGNGRRALELTNHPDAKPGENHARLVTRALMNKVVELQGAGKFRDALLKIDEILASDPTHMWAWATRVFILYPIRSAEKSPAEIQRLTKDIEATLQAPLDLLRSKYLALPQLQESVRSTWQRALNGVAWTRYETSNDPAELEEALCWIDRALSAFVKDDRSYLLDTQVRILLKLGRSAEAFAVAAAALAKDPAFGDFQDIKASAEYRSWKKSAPKAKPRWRHHFLDEGTLLGQGPPATLLGQLMIESHPVIDPFGEPLEPFDPARSLVLRRILALAQKEREKVLELSLARDPSRVPELAEMDNIFGPTHSHQLSLETLIGELTAESDRSR